MVRMIFKPKNKSTSHSLNTFASTNLFEGSGLPPAVGLGFPPDLFWFLSLSSLW